MSAAASGARATPGARSFSAWSRLTRKHGAWFITFSWGTTWDPLNFGDSSAHYLSSLTLVTFFVVLVAILAVDKKC